MNLFSAATVTFSVVDAVVLRPLPFDHSEQLVHVSGRKPDGWPTSLAPEEFWAIHDHVAALDAFASLRKYPSPVTVEGVTEEVPVQHSTADLFRVYRVKPVLGRVWTSDEEARGETSLAVIGHEFWQRRFASDPGVLNRALRIRGFPTSMRSL